MSKYGFDLDGTADNSVITQLANDLYDAGHEVYIITGGVADTGEWTVEARIAKCARLGLKYTEIVRCFGETLQAIGAKKAEEIARLGVTLMLEDSPDYANECRKQCLVLFMVPRA